MILRVTWHMFYPYYAHFNTNRHMENKYLMNSICMRWHSVGSVKYMLQTIPLQVSLLLDDLQVLRLPLMVNTFRNPAPYWLGYITTDRFLLYGWCWNNRFTNSNSHPGNIFCPLRLNDSSRTTAIINRTELINI